MSQLRSRRAALVALGLVLISGAAAQSRANSEFVEEFVRRSAPGTPQVLNPNDLTLERTSSFKATAVTLKDLVGWAYPFTHSQVTGGPEWLPLHRLLPG